MVLNEHILADQVWGIRPASKRRRRAALRAWLGDVVLFGAVIALIQGIAIAIAFAYSREFPPETFVIPFSLGILFGAMFCFVAPLRLDTRFSSAHVLRANVHDYYLAGVSGRGILAGLAAPQIAGFKLFGWVYGIVMFAYIIAVAIQVKMRTDQFFFVSTIVLASIYELVAGSYYGLSLWTKHSGRGIRALKVFVFLMTSPILLFIVTSPFVVYRGNDATIGAVYLEYIAMMFRGTFVRHAWESAIERLDRNVEEVLNAK